MEGIEKFIKERKALGINNYKSLPIEKRDSQIEITDDNEIKGYAIVWGAKNMHDEVVLKGATLNSLNARGVGSEKNSIAFLYMHDQKEPIATLEELREDDYGLYFRAKFIEGDDTASKAKNRVKQGVLRQISVGFNYIWDAIDYNEEMDAYILREIKLFEISLVTISSDEGAQLRTFGEYQRNETVKGFSLRSLTELKNLIDSEISSRDEHSDKVDEQDNESTSNVTIF